MSAPASLYVAYTMQSMAGTLLTYSLYEVQSVDLIFTLWSNVNHSASAWKNYLWEKKSDRNRRKESFTLTLNPKIAVSIELNKRFEDKIL